MSKELSTYERNKADLEYNKAKLKRLKAQIDELNNEAVLITDNISYLKRCTKKSEQDI